ncbi:MAG: hypothetical protein PWQ70_3190 [Clostridiales bacterium]|jgi:hypothetical protein|nr:hypothetical protein [Clostridiales bacterium]
MDENYDGNLVDLLELFSPAHPLAVGTEIDNKKLDGYLERFFNHPELCNEDCNTCGYCSKYALESIGQIGCNFLKTLNYLHKKLAKEFYQKLDE